MTRHALVTGANRGIGAAIAERLLRLGYPVTILCRDPGKARVFIESMNRQGLTALDALEADLGSAGSAREAAARIRKEIPHFSHFIHNAGIWPVEKALNEDGLEQSFVTNHLGPFILNYLLEDLFIKNRCRVVQVSAALYPLGMRNVRAAATGENFTLMRTYATTKLFNLVASMRFAERWDGKGATMNAVHPGVVRTGLGEMTGPAGIMLRMLKIFLMSPARGAEAPVKLATEEPYEKLNGAYFDRSKKKELLPMARDRDFIQEIWDQAVKLGGLED